MKRKLAAAAALMMAVTMSFSSCSEKDKKNNSSIAENIGGGDMTTTEEEETVVRKPLTSLDKSSPIPEYFGVPAPSQELDLARQRLNIGLPEGVTAEEQEDRITVTGKGFELEFFPVRTGEDSGFEESTDFGGNAAYRDTDSADTTVLGYSAKVKAANVNEEYIDPGKGVVPEADIYVDYGETPVGKWGGLWIRLTSDDPDADTNIYNLLSNDQVRAVLGSFEIVSNGGSVAAASGGVSAQFPDNWDVEGVGSSSVLRAHIDEKDMTGTLTVSTVKTTNIQTYVMAASDIEQTELISRIFSDKEYIGYVKKAVVDTREVEEEVDDSSAEDTDSSSLSEETEESGDSSRTEGKKTVKKTVETCEYIVDLYGVFSDDRCVNVSYCLKGKSYEEALAFLDSQTFTGIMDSLSADPAGYVETARKNDESGFECSPGGVITAYTGKETKLTVPESVGGVPVVAIGPRAFADNNDLTSVELPSSVASIDTDAFYGCTNLASIRFGDGLMYIGPMAFEGCSSLKDVKLPSSVCCLSAGAFRNAGTGSFTAEGPLTLDSRTFADSGFSSIEIAPYSDVSAPYALAYAGASAITIGAGATELGEGGLSGCTALETVVLPRSLKKLGYFTFGNDVSLRRLMLPEGIEVIPADCFSGASPDVLILPRSVKTIEAGAITGANYVVLQNMKADLADRAITTDNLYLKGVYNKKGVPKNFEEQRIHDHVFLAMDATIKESDNFDKYLDEIGFGTISWIGSDPAFIPEDSRDFQVGDNKDLIGYSGLSNEMYIPFNIYDGEYGAPIYRVAAEAFENSSLTAVYIHSNIDNLPSRVFGGSKDLKDIWFSGAVTRLSEEFFADDCLAGLPDDITVHIPERLPDEDKEYVEKLLVKKGLPKSADFDYYTLD